MVNNKYSKIFSLIFIATGLLSCEAGTIDGKFLKRAAEGQQNFYESALGKMKECYEAVKESQSEQSETKEKAWIRPQESAEGSEESSGKEESPFDKLCEGEKSKYPWCNPKAREVCEQAWKTQFWAFRFGRETNAAMQRRQRRFSIEMASPCDPKLLAELSADRRKQMSQMCDSDVGQFFHQAWEQHNSMNKN